MPTRSAGVVFPLFSLHSRAGIGCGEILDLIVFGSFCREMGHNVIQLLPIHETAPGERSPYNALSVFAIEPAFISISRLRGLTRRSLKAARAALDAGAVISRQRLLEVKLPLLERSWERFRASGSAARRDFEEFVELNRDWLDDYALFRALKEHFAWRSWEEWPADLARRDSAAIAAARVEFRDGVEKFQYWQFLAHSQWAAMRESCGRGGTFVGGDLAFSPSRDSADVWANQQMFDLGRSVGTPPDAFSALGQRWGLPMPNWVAMREDDYRWWRMRVRHSRALYDLFRIDHVVGLYRTFSFGIGEEQGQFSPPTEEAQREQGERFLRMVLEEAGESALIAEDLGTVPPWIRASLTGLHVPGYKVMRWEKEWDSAEQPFINPATYPEMSVATTGTHDTESMAEWWRTTTAEERSGLLQALELQQIDASQAILDLGTLDAILGKLYASPSRLVLIPLQDLMNWEDRINLPGTIDDANWSYRLAQPIETLAATPAIRERSRNLRQICLTTGRFT